MIDLELQKRALNPAHQGEAAPREKILKLGQKITDVMAHKFKGITADDPEYWAWRLWSPTKWRTLPCP